MDTRPTSALWLRTLLAGFIALAGGCLHTEGVVIPPPPDGAVPTELSPVILPRYVISPPDVLYVQVLQAPYTYNIPPRKTAEKVDEVTEARTYFSIPLSPVPIDNTFVVQMDGYIDLGVYGSVKVAGLTSDEARERVRAFLLQVTNRAPDLLQVRVTVAAFNSKQYYVITDGAGYGERIAAFPITGSDTVLDAMARIGGLPEVAAKGKIWVARRSPNGGSEQILPVCWEDITKKGITRTNYQILPGDRVYVDSQAIIKGDNNLAKVLQPIERLLGVTLLGSETVNSIKNRSGTGTTP
jgi:polysaccharide export outer membrane protein